MPRAATESKPLLLVFGEDDFAVKQRAKEVFQEWCAEFEGMDHDIIDAAAANSGDALKAIGKLREAINTLPFFGGGKVVWFKNCNFLGDDRTASTKAVTEALGEMARELKEFSWENIRLLISSGKVDKRKTFYKTIEKSGSVEALVSFSAEDRDWAGKAELWARRKLRESKKEVTEEALAEFVVSVGPNLAQLTSELEKLSLYAGDRAEIAIEDVAAITTRNKQARAFALAEALGDRDLPRTLRRLDEELWAMKFDSQKSEIGLLYGLITKVRVLLMVKEMFRQGWLKPVSEYNRFKAQLDQVPREQLPEEKKFNPLSLNPYVLFKALPQANSYTTTELVQAMEILLRCNQKLISSSVDASLILQQTLVQIIGGAASAPKGRDKLRQR